MFFENRYRRLKIIGLRNSFQVQSTISFLISTFYRPTNIYQFSTSFQISGLLNSKIYQPRICYQNATRYQPPKSEFINESDNLSFTKYLSKLNDFVLFFKMERNELLDVTAYGLRSDFLSPETMPKATVELALTKNRKLLLASVLPPVLYLIFLLILFVKYNNFIKRSKNFSMCVGCGGAGWLFYYLWFVAKPCAGSKCA